ncbi:MAG TPA: nucleotidyltransferase family protein [Streptosporangiaceae bacterium]|nr:nucleotidyltransferase family protein [Streptosporangiaceae bacterium]
MYEHEPHVCPGLEAGSGARLAELLAAEPWMIRALGAVAGSDLPDAWVGAGVVRDLVCGQYHCGFDPATVKDVDVAYYDAADLTMERDLAAQEELRRIAPGLPWGRPTRPRCTSGTTSTSAVRRSSRSRACTTR